MVKIVHNGSRKAANAHARKARAGRSACVMKPEYLALIENFRLMDDEEGRRYMCEAFERRSKMLRPWEASFPQRKHSKTLSLGIYMHLFYHSLLVEAITSMPRFMEVAETPCLLKFLLVRASGKYSTVYEGVRDSRAGSLFGQRRWQRRGDPPGGAWVRTREEQPPPSRVCFLG